MLNFLKAKCKIILPDVSVQHDDRIDAYQLFLCPRHSKNGGGALSVTPIRACIRPFEIRMH